jgi:polyisoprenyl-teichoic acid--peptidoglycan teichoic acid transferase
VAFNNKNQVRGKHATHAAQPGVAQQRPEQRGQGAGYAQQPGWGYAGGYAAGQGAQPNGYVAGGAGHVQQPAAHVAVAGGTHQQARTVGENVAGQVPYSKATGYHLPIVGQNGSQRAGYDAPQNAGNQAGAGFGSAVNGGAAQGAGYGTQQYNRGATPSGAQQYARGASACSRTGVGAGAGTGTGTPAQSRTNAVAYYSQMRGKHKGKGKRIAAIVGIVLLVVVLACAACGLWFSSQLDGALSSSDGSDTSSVLTPAKAGEPFYMLVLGSDSRENSGTSSKADESGDNQRSDVMILLRVDAANNKATMVSIPRDTPYRTSDGRLVKINEAYNIGGAAESIKAVSELTGVGISHYAEVHFSELEGIVDKLGGVDVNVDIKLSYTDALTGEKVTLQPGKQTLNGQQAQLFARARHEYETDQDKHRQNNVRQLALAIVKKTLSMPLTQMPQALIDVAGMVGTDMRTGDILALALQYAGTKGADSMTVYSASGPSSGDYNTESGGLWLCYENPEGWEKLMKVVDAGEDPSGLDLESTAIIPSS